MITDKDGDLWQDYDEETYGVISLLTAFNDLIPEWDSGWPLQAWHIAQHGLGTAFNLPPNWVFV